MVSGLLVGAASLLALTAHAQTIELKAAVETAIATHPQIHEAIREREAIEFEHRQAQGRLLPQVSVGGAARIRRLDNATRKSLGITDGDLHPLEAEVRARQVLLDFGYRASEVRRQASRIDGAAFRVEGRAQVVALEVVRHYLDYLLQQRIVAAAQDNAAFHERLAADLLGAAADDASGRAERQQVDERLHAARARVTEAQQDLVDAASAFRGLTGLMIEDAAMLPPALGERLPASLPEAIDLARAGNPRVKEAQADLDAAHALVLKARADLLPTVAMEASARIGEDIDGFKGETDDLSAGAVLQWDVFDGGSNRAKVKEMVRRESQSRFRLEQNAREAEQDMRVAWNAKTSQHRLLSELERQAGFSDEVLAAYREQLKARRRPALDVLEAQDTRFNVKVKMETARFAELFAQYKVLAAASRLLQALDIALPAAAQSDARTRYQVEPAEPDDPDELIEQLERG